MGEGTRDRSSKRQRSFHGVDVKSSSDSELAHGKGKSRKAKSKERWPFSDGLTVDELARYRRRRVQGHSKDNLGPCAESEIVDKDLSTEYRRAFRASTDDLLKENTLPEENNAQENPQPETDPSEIVEDDETKEQENLSLSTHKKDPDPAIVLADDSKKMETETESSRFVAHVNPLGRPPLTRSTRRRVYNVERNEMVKRNTSLKHDGEFYGDTETYSAYVAYAGYHKPELARRPTSLKMVGEMNTMTEKCEKFIQWWNVSRPELMRVPTHLKLEGDFETSTENHDKYVPFVGVRRRELRRHEDNLKLEGESRHIPEYTDVFKQPILSERRVSRKPESIFKGAGQFSDPEERSQNLTNPHKKETHLMKLTPGIEEEEDEEEKEKRRMREEEKKKQDEMNLLVSKLEELKGPPLETPEYKDAYKIFPRERPKISKPKDEIGRSDGSKFVSSTSTPKFTTKIDQDPEYKSKYLNYLGDRLPCQKPPINPRNSQSSSRRNSGIFPKSLHQDTKHFDCASTNRSGYSIHQPTSEVKSQYVLHGRVPRVESTRIPTSLRLEGNFDLQPEYRDAYCSKRDYQISTERQVNRRQDHSPSCSKKKENYWLMNDNREQFGQVNAAQDQDAFQVLHTRVHEDSVVNRPPTGSRRGSQVLIQRPTQLGISERMSIHSRSPSPTYRLHVCNVDDKPRGFGRQRRSPSLQSSSRTARSPSPDHLPSVYDETGRAYSPSFGKQRQTDKHSFVVLDGTTNAKTTTKHGRRAQRMDGNCNIGNLPMGPIGRPGTPTNWMPPWYDSTNTI